MFDNYSVATASRHPSSIPCRDLTFPYCDSPRDFPRTASRHISISQLSQRFSEQQLHHDAMPHVRSEPCTTSKMDRRGSSFADGPGGTHVGTATASSRRLQRQVGVRMLCDASHLRSIQEMVGRMVHSESQCVVTHTRTDSFGEKDVADAKYDEGYSSLEDNSLTKRSSTSSPSISTLSSSCSLLSTSCNTNTPYRRSSDLLSTTGASVSKKPRMLRIRKRRNTPSAA